MALMNRIGGGSTGQRIDSHEWLPTILHFWSRIICHSCQKCGSNFHLLNYCKFCNLDLETSMNGRIEMVCCGMMK